MNNFEKTIETELNNKAIASGYKLSIISALIYGIYSKTAHPFRDVGFIDIGLFILIPIAIGLITYLLIFSSMNVKFTAKYIIDTQFKKEKEALEEKLEKLDSKYSIFNHIKKTKEELCEILLSELTKEYNELYEKYNFPKKVQISDSDILDDSF